MLGSAGIRVAQSVASCPQHCIRNPHNVCNYLQKSAFSSRAKIIVMGPYEAYIYPEKLLVPRQGGRALPAHPT